MSEIQILIKFKDKIIMFLDELIEQFPEEGDLVIIRIFMKDQIPIDTIMTYFIIKIIPLKEEVKNRDESFFLNNNILFDEIDKGKVNHFKRLWRSPQIDDNDKNIIWKWFDLFILYVQKYQKVKCK